MPAYDVDLSFARAQSLIGGVLGQIPYQLANSSTVFIGTGTNGSILQMSANTATFVTTSTVYVNSAVNANTLRGGTTGQLVYQSAANTTAFAGPGTAGQLLVSAGAAAPVYTNTGSIYVNRAVLADNDSGGAAGGLRYQTGANASTFLAIGTAGQILRVNAGATAPEWIGTASVYAGSAVSSQNLFGGTAGQLVYQSGVGTTTFAGPGTAGQVLTSAGTSAPTYVSTTTLYVGRAVVADSATGGAASATNLAGGTAGQVPYQTGAGATSFFGPGTAGQILVSAGTSAPTYTNTGSIYIGFANQSNNLLAGTAGQLVYQSAAGTTAFAGPGTAGQILVSAGTSAPTYTNTGSIYVNSSVFSEDLRGGTAGQLVYQSAADTTAFVGPGTAGQILVSAGTSAPTYTNTGSIYVNRAVLADNDSGGAAGSLRYQSAANASTFLSIGFAGSILRVNSGATAPEWVTTANTYVAFANQSNNLLGGTAGQLAYQSGAGVTAFAGPGTAGQLLVSAGAAAPVYTNTGSIYVNRAVLADNDSGGAAGGLRYQTGANASTFLSIGTAGQMLRVNSGATAPEWLSTGSIYVGFANQANNLLAGTAGQLVYQSAAGTTAFAGPGTTGQVLTSGGTNAPTYVSTGSLYVGRALIADSATGGAASATNLAGGTAGQVPYQTGAGATSFFGPGTAGQILVSAGTSAPTYTNTGSIYVNRAVLADNDSGGAAGGLRYQTGANASTFLSIGTAGQILRVNAGATAPEWISTASVYSGASVSSQNLFGGTAGQLVYQSGAGVTAFAGPGTAGQILVSAGTSAPTYTSTGSIYINRAVLADNDVGGAAGGLRYQTGANASTFLAIGTAGQMLRVNAGATAPEWVSTGSFYSAAAVSSQNIFGGTTGQLHYQSGVGTTAFAGPGTAGQILVSAGAAAPVYTSTSSIYVNNAVRGDTILTTARPNAGLHYLTFVDANNASATAEVVYTTSTFNLDPRTGNVAIGTTATSNKFEVAGVYGQLFSVADTFTGTIFAASDISGIPSIEVLDTGLVKLAQYNGQVTINTATSISSSGLTAWTATWIRSVIVNQNGRIGSLGVGTDASGTTGEIRATNEITAYYSDRRLKENVQLIDDALTKVLSLHGITYTPNSIAETFGYDKTKQLVGVFADEVNRVLPQAVRPAPFDLNENGESKSGQNYKTVQYEKLVPLLIEAIKEQQGLINKLQADLRQLKIEIQSMR